MEQRLNYVTLAVADVGRSRAFYVDGLGWEPALEVPGEVLMIPLGAGLVLSLWSRDGFVDEVGEPSPGLAPLTLAHNVADEAGVDAAVADAVAAGGTLVGPAAHREWGGYTAYVADPDGFRWEIAHNPSDMGLAQVRDSQAAMRARSDGL
ncbi:VOC family protein [Solicola sp. PLA-1-18]|uniref:VOC family protein n=1 Tax=Solicola sp. PLA-1-18 TaxID=3380532 RepID=UPI003B7F30AF